jgi:hypothetical protein
MKTQEEIEQLAELYTNKIVEVAYHNFPLVILLRQAKHPKETVSKVIIALLKEYTTQCQEDVDDKRYTEADIRKAIELARETESVRRGALSEDWDDIEKYDEMDIINSLNKQD